jgi:hypothetical protein
VSARGEREPRCRACGLNAPAPGWSEFTGAASGCLVRHNPAPVARQVPTGTRVSTYYRLGLEQSSLEFLDVVLEGDTRLFVDPRAFLALRTGWADECVELIRDFFDEVIQAMHAGDDDRARVLLSGLSEPNETRLGLSVGEPRGKGVGSILAESLFESLKTSEAVKTGLIENLEDTALLVEGIASDRISDITSNIVREKLIEFTVRMASKYGMPLKEDIDSGALWNRESGEWENRATKMLYPQSRPLILVPRAVVRWKLDFDPGEYYRYHVLRFLRDRELAKGNSPLATVIKTGPRKGQQRINLKDVEKYYKKRYGGKKRFVVEATRDFPEILEGYKQRKERQFQPPESMEFLSEHVGVPTVKWGVLLKAVVDLPRGKATATNYHRAIEALLTPLFQPSLVDPIIEKEIESGTMRVDLRYRNMPQGFFRWFTEQFIKAPFIPFECKNYREDPVNPEIAQLASRLDSQKGRLGFLVCREIKDRGRFNRRCRSELDKNGNYIIGLDDGDLRALVAARKANDGSAFFKHMSDLVEALID